MRDERDVTYLSLLVVKNVGHAFWIQMGGGDPLLADTPNTDILYWKMAPYPRIKRLWAGSPISSLIVLSTSVFLLLPYQLRRINPTNWF